MTKKEQWNKSYKRKENNIKYPYEELVKFLSRNKQTKGQKALDYGCGIGRQTYLLAEFGYKAKGIDISTEAIKKARKLIKMKTNKPRFTTCNGKEIKEKQEYDLTICLSVLDSMTFKNAKKVIKQLAKITKKQIFISLMKGKQFKQKIQKGHENGTWQTTYTWKKIKQLTKEIKEFEIKDKYQIEIKGMIKRNNSKRYYLTLQKKEEQK